MRGVIDRFVGDFAVVLLEKQRVQLDVLKDEIPGDPEEGDWLQIKFIPDKKYTKERREEMRKMLDKLTS
ncbi:DUF3006 domain-containing protein [Natroniella acetigena]|uniref:DUF3006 domain-containing protein n=1 Tax=Natroniella acetigena TaxID=52004 RepID=UPI00200B0702|nr:DUF3006 domain-containing protein [Natroniella acetigena]MCK8828455.1 DUF3006 domain-containing protein [Natroniella acetigena]